MKKILIIVDPQNDFIFGKLAVPYALTAINKFLEAASKKNFLQEYDGIFVTIDNHPHDHCSFSSNGGIFNPHCINHTIGEAIYHEIEFALESHWNKVRFYTKGEESEKEEFSIFQTVYEGNRLLHDASIANNTVEEIHIMGIAGDYCVHDTIVDLIKKGHGEKIVVLTEFIASLDDGAKLNKLIDQESLKTLKL